VREREPIFNAPAVVVALLGAFVAMHLLRNLLSEQADERLIALLAFEPGRTGLLGASQFVTHLFLHGDVMHLVINSAWFLAFATPVVRRLGTVRFLAFFLLCGIGGALLYLAFSYHELNAARMIGASGAISGLMGAALRFLFVPLSQNDVEALAGDQERAPLLGLGAAFSDRRILLAIGGWTLLNVVVAWVAVLGEYSIAWQAHLGGFFTGLFTFGLFDPKPPVQHDSAPAE
jgi:membrane associated rhomboid family serine protease